MKEFTTKGMPVERVKPLALLGTTRLCGKSRMEIKRGCSAQGTPRSKEQWRVELLVRYGAKLIEQSDAIFDDARLFLTPVPIFGSVPLGVVIDWWQNYNCSQAEESDGTLHCIYDWEIGPYKKWGHECNTDKERGVYYIGMDGKSYFAPAHSVHQLRSSIEEVRERYKGVISCQGVFDLEDAIEWLLGVKVYEQL